MNVRERNVSWKVLKHNLILWSWKTLEFGLSRSWKVVEISGSIMSVRTLWGPWACIQNLCGGWCMASAIFAWHSRPKKLASCQSVIGGKVWTGKYGMKRDIDAFRSLRKQAVWTFYSENVQNSSFRNPRESVFRSPKRCLWPRKIALPLSVTCSRPFPSSWRR